MIIVDLDCVELKEPEDGLRYEFPLHEGTGNAGTAVVVFELDPGATLGTHTDSAEEILLVLAGSGEATVGDERGPISAGQLAVVPASVPHGVRNTGSSTLRVVGFFSASAILSYFSDGPDGAPLALVNGVPAELGSPVSS